MQDFRKLEVWRKAHALALTVHRVSATVEPNGSSGLIGQMRRAAQSIPSNIAEGCGRETSRDLAKFLQIAIGSATELEGHLQFAVDSFQIPQPDFDSTLRDLIEVRRMLHGLLKRVREAADRAAGIGSRTV